MRRTGPFQPVHLLLDILDLLNEFGIPHAVVGALAVSYYGIPRSTTDADSVIWVLDTGKSERDVADGLLAAGYRVELRRGGLDDPISRCIFVQDEYENRVDLLAGVRGMDPEAAHRCIRASLLDSEVRIIGAEDLIAMKIFAGGLQDLEDVRGIIRVSGNTLNPELLRTLAHRYGANVTRTLDKLLKEPLPEY